MNNQTRTARLTTKRWLATLTASMLPMAANALNPSIHNAPLEVIIPQAVPLILADVSPNASDPSLIFRFTTMATTAWYDAIAPYDPAAVGIHSRLPRQPASQRTDRNRNIAILYANYHVFNSVMPTRKAEWRQMMLGAGLNPDNQSTSPNTPEGIGNLAGAAVVQARIHDGMNQLGDEGGCEVHCQPYADYTGYAPKNTAYRLTDPSHWQPSMGSNGYGIFTIQQFVTPQLGQTTPYSYQNPSQFRAPVPKDSNVHNRAGYKAQADVVLNAQATLDDVRKMKAEFFDNKFGSVLTAVAHVIQTQNMGLEDTVRVELLTNAASFDTAIAIWHNKYHYDAVRPFSAIAHLYKKQPVQAWAGPGLGTQDIPADQWKSYMPVANHPEYPSATASFCASHAAVMRRYTGTDVLNLTVPIAAGSSRIEPGVTPATPLTLHWNTWTEFENDCGQSRIWGGVHFPASVPAGMDIGHGIGASYYDFAEAHFNGTAP